MYTYIYECTPPLGRKLSLSFQMRWKLLFLGGKFPRSRESLEKKEKSRELKCHYIVEGVSVCVEEKLMCLSPTNDDSALLKICGRPRGGHRRFTYDDVAFPTVRTYLGSLLRIPGWINYQLKDCFAFWTENILDLTTFLIFTWVVSPLTHSLTHSLRSQVETREAKPRIVFR